MIEIPLNSNPEQLFSISLNSQTFDVRVLYNHRADVWTMTFSIEGSPVLSGVPLVSGVNILEQYDIGISNLFLINVADAQANTSIDDLGTSSRLFVLTDEELEGLLNG